MELGITALVKSIDMAKKAVSLLREAMNLLPDSKERREAETALYQAETAFKIAEANAAKDLGYELCKCAWPPGIMIEIGDNMSECLVCKKRKHHDSDTPVTAGTMTAPRLLDGY